MNVGQRLPSYPAWRGWIRVIWTHIMWEITLMHYYWVKISVLTDLTGCSQWEEQCFFPLEFHKMPQEWKTFLLSAHQHIRGGRSFEAAELCWSCRGEQLEHQPIPAGTRNQEPVQHTFKLSSQADKSQFLDQIQLNVWFFFPNFVILTYSEL